MKELLVAILIVLAIGAIIVSPLVTIWSLNNLFNLNIAYNFSTWAASFWIIGIFSASKITYKKD
jgi:hypothetical protein